MEDYLISLNTESKVFSEYKAFFQFFLLLIIYKRFVYVPTSSLIELLFCYSFRMLLKYIGCFSSSLHLHASCIMICEC